MLSAFLLSYISSSLIYRVNNSSATSPSTISGSDTAPVSVSVSNSPLAYYISVSSSHGSAGTPVSLSYSQDGSSGGVLGNVVSSSDNVYLETNSPLTHQLLLSTTSPSTTTKSNNLTGDNTQESGGIPVLNTYIAPVGNTTTSSLNSATTLSSNTWGFAMSSNTRGIESNNFDSDYSTTTNDSKFTTVPVNGSEVLLTQDTEPTSNTTIYYGVLANRDIPAGSYSNTVLYTALAEQPSEIRVSSTNASTGAITTNPAIIDISSTASLHSTVTIYTSINTTADNLGTATVTFKDNSNNTAGTVEDTLCGNPVVNRDSDNFIYVTCTSPAMPTGTYSVELTLPEFGRILAQANAIEYSGAPLIQSITNMQQMTTDICKTMPFATTTGANVYTLTDARGTNKSYRVAHLADGNCWMVSNLALDGGITITPSDSNVTINVALPATASSGSSNRTSIQIWAKNGNYDGNYYNWCAAIADASNCSTTTEPATSICPKGWRLPSNSGNPSYENLFDATGIAGSMDATTRLNTLESAPYYYTRAGRYHSGYLEQGYRSYYWSHTPYASDYAYNFDYTANSFYPQDGDLKKDSLSVRCVYGS